MKTENYSASQCGQKQCTYCGQVFIPDFSNVKKGYGLYCSLQCRSQHRHLKTMVVRECAQCGNLYLVKIQSSSRYCSRACSMVTLHSRRRKSRYYRGKKIQGRKLTSRNGRIKSRGSLFGKARHRECANLRKWFGTANVSESVRMANALRYIGSRISGGRPVRQIDKDAINAIINRIEKGETYAAYE